MTLSKFYSTPRIFHIHILANMNPLLQSSSEYTRVLYLKNIIKVKKCLIYESAYLIIFVVVVNSQQIVTR